MEKLLEAYPVIYADPPWKYPGQRPGGYNTAADHYQVMSIEDIADLPVWKLLDNPGVLFMWATGPLLEDALKLGSLLNLHYRGIAFDWIKTKKDGTPMKASGVRPSIVKPLTELGLAFSTKKTGRPLPLASESVVQTVFAPRREHSRKPPEIAERIDQLYPGLPKLEVFARQARPGWSVWGNETDKFDEKEKD